MREVLKHWRDSLVEARMEWIESDVYRTKHFRKTGRRTLWMTLLVWAFMLVWMWAPEPWSSVAVWPIIVFAILGCGSLQNQAATYTMGWMSGRIDLFNTLRSKDFEVVEGLAEAGERNIFVVEGFGLEKGGRYVDMEKEEENDG